MAHSPSAYRCPVFRVGQKGDVVATPGQVTADFEERAEVTGDGAGRYQVVRHIPPSCRNWTY